MKFQFTDGCSGLVLKITTRLPAAKTGSRRSWVRSPLGSKISVEKPARAAATAHGRKIEYDLPMPTGAVTHTLRKIRCSLRLAAARRAAHPGTAAPPPRGVCRGPQVAAQRKIAHAQLAHVVERGAAAVVAQRASERVGHRLAWPDDRVGHDDGADARWSAPGAGNPRPGPRTPCGEVLADAAAAGWCAAGNQPPPGRRARQRALRRR